MAQEHYVYQNGEMLQIRDQQQTRLQERLSLNNGAIVNPDGSYQLKNGTRLQLRDGECLDPDGNKYQNQQRFREKMEAKLKEKGDRVPAGKGKEKMKQGTPARKKGSS